MLCEVQERKTSVNPKNVEDVIKTYFDINNVLNYFDPNFPQDSKNHT